MGLTLGRPGGEDSSRLSPAALATWSFRPPFESLNPVAITVTLIRSPHVLVQHRPEDDVGVGVGRILDQAAGFVDFVQSETFAGRDVHENSPGALDGGVIQQWTAHRAGGRRQRPAFPFSHAGPHQSQSRAAHDGFDIGEVQVDEPGHIDEVGDSLNRLAEDVVGIGEGVGQRRAGSQRIQQPPRWAR